MLSLLLAAATIIAIENQKAGTADWDIRTPALAREIEGYASKASVNGGESIELFVSTRDPLYTIDVFRMGWVRRRGRTTRRGADRAKRRHAGNARAGSVSGTRGVPLSRSSRAADARRRRSVDERRLPRAADRASLCGAVVHRLRRARRYARVGHRLSVERDDVRGVQQLGRQVAVRVQQRQRAGKKVSFDRPYAMNSS